MTVPEAIQKQAFGKDTENNRILIDCPRCNEYDSEVDVDKFDDAEKALNQARRQLGAHWSAAHEDSEEGGQGGTTSQRPKQEEQSQPSKQPSQNQQPPPESEGQERPQLSNRELIRQRGRDGLKEIKKQRLKNWLDNTQGVGAQTESRILMVFDRNESVHTNPHVLFNLLDDELSASSSYINTMVEDVFGPEREHEDLLRQQGYTPWFRKNNMDQRGGGQMGRGPGGQQYGQGPGGQQGFRGGPQQQGGQQQQDQGISRQEAAHMVQQGIEAAEEQGKRNALLTGLSEATDEAVREMASNVGGLAGTVQRVVDEALVEYARKNPEWVIENMGMLQKVLGAVDEPEGEEGRQEQAEQDLAVDQALSDIGQGSGGIESDFTPSQETQQAMSEDMSPKPMSESPPQEKQRQQRRAVEQQESQNNQQVEQEVSEPEPEPKKPHGGASDGKDGPPEPAPKPGGEAEEKSEMTRQKFEERKPETDEEVQDSEGEEVQEEEGWEDIFGKG